MESSSQVCQGDTEECSSSESGWTMYIASPMHEDDDDAGEDADAGDAKGNNHARNVRNNDDSDDSMTSDASSGQKHQESHYPYGNGDYNRTASYEENKSSTSSKYFSCKQQQKKANSKQMEKTRIKAGDKKDEKSNLNATTSVPTTQARKSKWFSRGK